MKGWTVQERARLFGREPWNRGESGQRERQGKGAKAMGSSSRRPATCTGSLLRARGSDGKHPIKYDVFNADALIRKATPEVNICSQDEKKEPSPFYRNLF